MTPEDHQQLTQFLNTFDAIGLGEGDINAGINALATMLCTAANIARPGSSIMSPDKRLSPVGTHTLVSGALSSSLVTDHVIDELLMRQNNLSRHLERVRAVKEKEDAEDSLKLANFSDKHKANESESALFSILNENSPGIMKSPDQWSTVTNNPPNPGFEGIVHDSKIIISASSACGLEKQIHGTHMGKALVIHELNQASASERMASICSALMNGGLPDGVNGKTVQGNLILTDPDNRLAQMAKLSDENSIFLGRCIWLVDGYAGPEVLDYTPSPSQLDNVHTIFRFGLSRAIGKRLNHKSPYPTIHQLDISRAQVEWLKFLKGIEDSIPGISGHARNLLATLVFGVLELTSGQIPPAKPNPLLGIEAFAKLIILRMANARKTMTYSVREARNDELKESILHKLQDGPHTVRDLTRRFSRLPTSPCRELLHDLEKEKKVMNLNGEWQLQESATSKLTLDV